MAEWIKQLGEGIKWLLSLFTSLFGVIQDHPIMLYGVLLTIVVFAVGIVFRVLRGFGIKPRRR